MIDYKDLNLSEEELDSLRDQLNNRKKYETFEEYKKTIKEHQKYIGKCFKEKDKNKYIRVLSSKSSNQFRFECMCFEFPVNFIEHHNYSMVFSSEDAFSQIDFEGIYVEDYPLLCVDWKNKKGNILQNLIEISEDEYFSKMDEYIKELQEKIKNGDFDTSKNI